MKFLPFTYVCFLIASISLLAFPFITGYYSKDVRYNRFASKWTILHGYFSNILPALELSFMENWELNIAFLVRASFIGNLILFRLSKAVVSKVKAILPKVQYPLSSREGNSHGRYGTIRSWESLNLCDTYWDDSTRSLIKTFKDLSGQPKETLRVAKVSVGLPKGGNTYGNRAIIVLQKGRIAANLSFSRYYSTGSGGTKVNVKSKLKDLYLRSKNITQKPIDRNVYKLICDIEILKLAYENLKSKPGIITKNPGINPETLDGLSIDSLNKIRLALLDESFKFNSGRRIIIPKASGGERPKTIASPRDKLVLEVIRIILEAIYEPTFLDNSIGFRSKRSCHSAFKYINKKFKAANWWIEGDITLSSGFDSINHTKLITLIEIKILDRKFTKLIWKSLKAGHFEFFFYFKYIKNKKKQVSGGKTKMPAIKKNKIPLRRASRALPAANPMGKNFTPQGSIISPILANIYLHQFDHFMLDLKSDFDLGKESRVSPAANRLHYFTNKAKKAFNLAEVVRLTKLNRTIPWTNHSDPKFKQLTYVRYANDWVVGIKGSLKDAKNILSKIKTYLATLDLKLNEDKTHITNVATTKAKFLGVHIIRAASYSFSRVPNVSARKRQKLSLRIIAPIQDIRKKLALAGFMKNGKSYPKFVWISLTHRQIIALYNTILHSYLNYYSFVHNFGRLASFIEYTLRGSCAKLLAAKFTIKTQNKVFKKFGKQMKAVTYEKNNRIKKGNKLIVPPPIEETY